MLHSHRIASEGLQLRAWAARRLLGDGGCAEPPPSASAEGWRLFLRLERCAALLERSLAAAPVEMDGIAMAALRSSAGDELRRILSARGQLRVVGDAARALGIEVLVLKGTADVARGAPVLVMDVDVLARPPDAQRLAAALDAHGFVPAQDDGVWHLRPRRTDGALQVEVHVAVTGFDAPEAVPWTSVQPLPGLEPLVALASGDHAWTVLNQAARKHPDRLRRLRDLWMLRQALAEMGHAERDELLARVDGDEMGELMRGMLGAAEGALEFSSTSLLRRTYLFGIRMPPPFRRGILNSIHLLTADSLAAGTMVNRRRLARSREDAGRRKRSFRHAARDPGLVLAAILGRLVTFDAAWLQD